METHTESPLFADAGPVIERQDAGEDIVLMCRGLPVASFRRSDGVGRDVAIAALIRLGLKTDTIAGLCDSSHGWVCEVRARLASNGLSGVISRGKRGRPRRIVGRAEDKLREMRAAGATLADIADQLGVSESLVSLEVKRLNLPRRGVRSAQVGLAGVGAGGVEAEREARRAHVQQNVATATRGADTAPSSASPSASSDMGETSPTLSTEVMSGTAPAEACEQNREGEVDAPTLVVEAGAAMVVMSAAACASESDGSVESGSTGLDNEVLEAEFPSNAGPTSDELQPGARLPSGPAEHLCRYAGTLLLSAAAMVIGVGAALRAAGVARPKGCLYDASQVLLAMMASWTAGYGSLEAMHERDARALGVVLGLERSPSVRTLHRAIAQIGAVFDPIELMTGLMRGLISAHLPERWWFGFDSHFKAYFGDEPIDKGWDSKRRIAAKGLSDVYVTDEGGWAWYMLPIAAGDSLSQHVLTIAQTMRGTLGDSRPIVLAFDRGGFSFDDLDALDRAGFFYVGYVPATVTLPDLASIAPTEDGVDEVLWEHARLHHPARLLVERDGQSLIPAVTNLPTLVDPDEVMRGLRKRRGFQENSFKAAREFAHIDHLVDRGGATRSPDDRLVPNPVRAALKKTQKEVLERKANLEKERPGERARAEINEDLFWTEVDALEIKRKLREAPAKVPHVSVEPDAQRATLKTKNRLLIQPLKLAADNARRWLLATLGSALAPTDQPGDQDALCRTLVALLQAPGSVRFDDEHVVVTIELPLPPTPHARLAAALEELDRHSLRFPDGLRLVHFRLAPRPTRASLPSATVGRR
jgi:hypothetical protein